MAIRKPDGPDFGCWLYVFDSIGILPCETQAKVFKLVCFIFKFLTSALLPVIQMEIGAHTDEKPFEYQECFEI
jgi:hypothetical protein